MERNPSVVTESWTSMSRSGSSGSFGNSSWRSSSATKPYPDVLKDIYHGCGRCIHVLRRDGWLLDSVVWDLQGIGAVDNGKLHRATCRETGCEHAAKFLPCFSGKRKCNITEKMKCIDTRSIVKAICSGVSRNPAACGAAGAPRIVLLFDLLYRLVLSP